MLRSVATSVSAYFYIWQAYFCGFQYIRLLYFWVCYHVKIEAEPEIIQIFFKFFFLHFQ